jgi:hypothetical protein
VHLQVSNVLIMVGTVLVDVYFMSLTTYTCVYIYCSKVTHISLHRKHPWKYPNCESGMFVVYEQRLMFSLLTGII